MKVDSDKTTNGCLIKHDFIYNVITSEDDYHKSFIGRFVRICLRCNKCEVEQFFPYLQPSRSVWMGIYKTENVENDILKWRAEHFAGIKWIDKLYP